MTGFTKWLFNSTIFRKISKLNQYMMTIHWCNELVYQSFDYNQMSLKWLVYQSLDYNRMSSGLKDSEHFSSMSYNNSNTQSVRRNRNRSVIWFNPSCSQNVKANIGKLFIKLVRKHFPKNSKYHNIFNLNTLKLSYCCTTNVGNIIIQHNSKVATNVIPDQNRTAHWMVSVSLDVLYTKLHLKHLATVLFTMELMKGSSKCGTITKKNLSYTVNTLMKLSYQNMCGT